MNLAFIQGIGPLELTIVLVIVLVIFGPKRLPAVARSVGSGLRELKDSIGSRADDDDRPATGERAALERPAEDEAPDRASAEAVPERR